jgi:hypothetical protein
MSVLSSSGETTPGKRTFQPPDETSRGSKLVGLRNKEDSEEESSGSFMAFTAEMTHLSAPSTPERNPQEIKSLSS